MIIRRGPTFLTVGDKVIPVKNVELDLEPRKVDQQERINLNEICHGGWTATWHFDATASTTESAPNVIDSTAVVIDENVKALPAPGEVNHERWTSRNL